jgi:arylsulfatase A-like enzyme
MKAIMVMFDSLNRNMLPPYGGDWVHAPNFQRLAEHTVTFDKAYIGSMPCMPARRELHTGRYNFLHRSWGPLEPYDDSMPEILKQNGVHTHLVTDHVHYFADGGANYHNRYSTWEFNRGQEGDNWKGYINPPFPIPPQTRQFEKNQHPTNMWKQEYINRYHAPDTASQPQVQTFNQGIEFIRNNHATDKWFLQIETFDPHEPFFSHDEYKALYPHDHNGDELDWISYGRNKHTGQDAEHLRYEYAALVSLCDAQLGRVLDVMDELQLWDDTLLIVCTDHGLLLGEHDWWGKNVAPWYNENANTPLFIWDPRCRKVGERRESVVQMIDLPASLLEFFAVDLPPAMQGVPLLDAIAADKPVHDAVLFGAFGSNVCVTDGRYVYMRAPITDNQPLYEYVLMPTHIRTRYSVEEIRQAQLSAPFDFMKGCPTLKIPGKAWGDAYATETVLYDLQTDPQQLAPIQDEAVEQTMLAHLIRLMKLNDAPPEQFERLGLLEQVATTGD